MNTKLTLMFNQEIIEKVKQYASHKMLSFLRLIENYLSSLNSWSSLNNDLQISPFVKNLSLEIILTLHYDYKKEQGGHL